jgi:hypothetical protein
MATHKVRVLRLSYKKPPAVPTGTPAAPVEEAPFTVEADTLEAAMQAAQARLKFWKFDVRSLSFSAEKPPAGYQSVQVAVVYAP